MMSKKPATFLGVMVIVVVCSHHHTVLAKDSPSGNGGLETSNTESVTVSKLREKLQQLYNMLKDGHQQFDHRRDNHRNDIPQTKNTDQAEKPTATMTDRKARVETHPKSRVVTSEDMGRTFERDTDEEELKHLVQNKSKRGQDGSVQILARALAQLRNLHSTDVVEDQTDAPVSLSLSGHAKSDITGNDSYDNDDDDGNDSGSKDHEKLVSYIMEAIDRLDNEGRRKEAKRENFDEDYLPSFDDDGDAKRGSDRATRLEDSRSNSHKTFTKTVSADVDGMDEEMIQALIDGGYIIEEKEPHAVDRKEGLLDKIETRLMDDIKTANSMGVSVDELIEDMEDRVFKSALLRRIGHILQSQKE